MTVKTIGRARYRMLTPSPASTLLVIHAPFEDEVDSQSSATETLVACELTTNDELISSLDADPTIAEGMQVFKLVPVKVTFKSKKETVKKASLTPAK